MQHLRAMEYHDAACPLTFSLTTSRRQFYLDHHHKVIYWETMTSTSPSGFAMPAYQPRPDLVLMSSLLCHAVCHRWTMRPCSHIKSNVPEGRKLDEKRDITDGSPSCVSLAPVASLGMFVPGAPVRDETINNSTILLTDTQEDNGYRAMVHYLLFHARFMECSLKKHNSEDGSHACFRIWDRALMLRLRKQV